MAAPGFSGPCRSDDRRQPGISSPLPDGSPGVSGVELSGSTPGQRSLGHLRHHLTFLRIFVYLIARGGKMHEQAAAQAAEQQKALEAYVKQTAGTGTDSN
jgi:hypothetical protein